LEESPTFDEPLGLGYLASYVINQGHEVKILDTLISKHVERDGDFYIYGMRKEDIKKGIREYKPDIVGIASMYTLHSKAVHDIAKIVKEINKDLPVVVGGSHASILPDWILSDKNIDMVVMGEGEETLLDIIKHIENGKSINDIPGTAIREKGKIKINKLRPLIANIDSIPYPARDQLRMDLYMNDYYRKRMAMRPPRANMVTSRGCFGNCVFCSIHAVWKHQWRGRSPEDVVNEIQLLKEIYGAKEIAFQDDNISLNRDRMEAICDGIIEKKLNIRWCTPNGIAIWTLDKPLIDKMKKSGCYKLTFGIETGCPETQKFIRKTQINLNKAKEIIKYCNKKGIWTHSAFVIGFPYETRENIKETIKYAVSTDLDMATFWIATPYPGTDLYTIWNKEGLLPPKEKMLEWTSSVERASNNTKYLTAEEIQHLRAEAHSIFFSDRKKKFLNPLRIMRKIRSVEELRYALKLTLLSGKVLKELTS
jgi:magnesium-protoporphyrin IX monomethyl ester (oxidative) cyclase